MRRSRVALVAATFAALAACGNGDGTPPADSLTPAATAGGTSTPSERTWNIEVEVRDGEVVEGAQRVRITAGDEVVLVVRSDVADEVHVHGYDEKAEVKAGGAVRIAFTADVPGVFIAELEERKLRILELEVR